MRTWNRYVNENGYVPLGTERGPGLQRLEDFLDFESPHSQKESHRFKKRAGLFESKQLKFSQVPLIGLPTVAIQPTNEAS